MSAPRDLRLPLPPSAPEVLAPAGDRDALEAAVRAGADAVYFGLESWNARARATNFTQATLGETMQFLHAAGCKGYVTLNTLVFDRELPAIEAAIRTAAAAGVDALIVQDLGVMQLAGAIAPTLPLHASTQMTCTDAGSVEFARSLGARRVVLARELSLDDIAKIRAGSDLDLEVFVHGALCIAYSGQCLTSEAIGGRSANRGACAQSCRLPYELVVDGVERPLGDRAYLLSPEDLEASALVSRLAELGVRSLKIEGRLKGPDYVAATTRLYREAVAASYGAPAPSNEVRETALQTYSRGSGPGFLAGIDHQRLVDGHACEHRGLEVGTLVGLARKKETRQLVVTLSRRLEVGDGVVIEGGHSGAGEVGGRVWKLFDGAAEVAHAEAGRKVGIWLGPKVRIDEVGVEGLRGHRVFRSSSPNIAKRAQTSGDQSAHAETIDVSLAGDIGAPARLTATFVRGLLPPVTIESDVILAGPVALDDATARAQLGRLGGTRYRLGALALSLPPGAGLPLSALNRTRRALVAALDALPARGHDGVPLPQNHAATEVTHAQLTADRLAALALYTATRRSPSPGLFVLCRNLQQARAALTAGAAGVYLDILELTGTGDAFRALIAEWGDARSIGVAPPRIRKPGEEKIDRFLRALGPQAVLVRGLGALGELGDDVARSFLAVGDFSLNVTNHLSAALVLTRGADVFTPSFDLDATQLRGLVSGPLARFAEVVIHHPMPLFHMEHCLIAAELSTGRDHLTCGRPCERHQLSLRDRTGQEHPVEADVGCRNTVFHGASQSAADVVPALQRAGVGRFRIELLRENPADVGRIVESYRRLLDGTLPPAELWRTLRTKEGYGVVRGSLRVMS